MNYLIKDKELISYLKENSELDKNNCTEDWTAVFAALMNCNSCFHDFYHEEENKGIEKYIENHFEIASPLKEVNFNTDKKTNELYFENEVMFKSDESLVFKVNKDHEDFKALKENVHFCDVSDSDQVKDCGEFLLVCNGYLYEHIRDVMAVNGSDYILGADFDHNIFKEYVWSQSRDFENQEIEEIHEDHEWNPDQIYSNASAAKLK